MSNIIEAVAIALNASTDLDCGSTCSDLMTAV